MKIERTKNTVRNITFGAVYRIINILLPFASRTVILYVLGDKYLGLSSLFTSILSFLSLAELGIGNAMVYSMYKPVAENDNETICALLNLYRKYYRIIGIIIFALGAALTPFLPRLIKGEVPPDVNLYLLYFIYLFNTVLSYFLFSYKTSILYAYQRNDVESKIASVVTPASYVVMLGMLFITKNYYAYIIWLPVFTIITNLSRFLYIRKHYPGLTPQGEVSKELRLDISKKVRAIFGAKLNTVVLNAADNIVMSVFFGLTVIAQYGNYYYILSSITGFLGIAYSAMTAGVGNSLKTETLDKNYADFEKFSFINSWLVGWCTICLACLYQPFMRIWAGEKLMFSIWIALQFCLYFYIYMIRKIPIIYKDAAGIWWEDRFRPYVSMIVNVVLNITLSKLIGVSGIILSTVISLIISIPWENWTIFKFVFHRSSKRYYLKMLYFFIVTLIAGGVTFFLCSLPSDTIPAFTAKMGICVVVPNVIFFAMNFKRPEFKSALELAKGILKIKK